MNLLAGCVGEYDELKQRRNNSLCDSRNDEAPALFRFRMELKVTAFMISPSFFALHWFSLLGVGILQPVDGGAEREASDSPRSTSSRRPETNDFLSIRRPLSSLSSSSPLPKALQLPSLPLSLSLSLSGLWHTMYVLCLHLLSNKLTSGPTYCTDLPTKPGQG